MRYGFVGLGTFGQAPRALNLARGGFDVRRARSRSRFGRCRARGRRALGRRRVRDSPRACDCLITCLPSPAATRRSSTRRSLPCAPVARWIEMSTNDFAEVEALASARRGLGGRHPRLPGHRGGPSRRGRRHHRISWRRATGV